MNIPVRKTTKEDFFSKLFEAVSTAKTIHLYQKDKNGFTHLAMENLYEKLSDISDTFYESYSGLYGTTLFTFSSKLGDTNALTYVQSVYNYIDTNRNLFVESFLQNEIDEMQALLAHTMYKLKYVL